MSSPISSFSKLSITQRMQSSRGHTRGLSGGKGKGKAPARDDDPSSSDESSDNDSEDGHDEGTDISWSGRLFALDHCRQHGTRYAFQISYAEVQRYSIRISTTDAGSPTCSCNEEGICRHVTWLLEQLSRTQMATGDESPVTPYEQISSIGLDTVCDELHWELREGTDSDTEETRWQLKKDYSNSELPRQTRGMIKERMKTVRDIMATLSAQVADDFRPDIFDTPDEISLEDQFILGDLEATLARILMKDDDIFHQLNALVPRNARATDYFRKMGLKAQHSLDLLDSYCEVGPTAAGQQHDIIWCAQELMDIVDAISQNVTERQPLSPASREEAAKSLVSILRVVVKDRNHDVYQNTQWPRRRPHGEPSIDRNLYERLIGTHSRVAHAGGHFILKALQDLPEAQPFVDDLEEVLRVLKTIGWGPAPKAYTEKLSAIIVQLKRGSGSSTSLAAAQPGKRPASSMERKVKRMK
ncbi:hypothetical protein N431DRAFT_425223 [Stipitochalara longipes BDJ]|nr:hypothetical protein N431DRAFT_425223 [Stipitochalara longipes BDJ]